jgi:hypothetical protein
MKIKPEKRESFSEYMNMFSTKNYNDLCSAKSIQNALRFALCLSPFVRQLIIHNFFPLFWYSQKYALHLRR